LYDLVDAYFLAYYYGEDNGWCRKRDTRIN
jgi:hypothetical protein